MEIGGGHHACNVARGLTLTLHAQSPRRRPITGGGAGPAEGGGGAGAGAARQAGGPAPAHRGAAAGEPGREGQGRRLLRVSSCACQSVDRPIDVCARINPHHSNRRPRPRRTAPSFSSARRACGRRWRPSRRARPTRSWRRGRGPRSASAPRSTGTSRRSGLSAWTTSSASRRRPCARRRSSGRCSRSVVAWFGVLGVGVLG